MPVNFWISKRLSKKQSQCRLSEGHNVSHKKMKNIYNIRDDPFIECDTHIGQAKHPPCFQVRYLANLANQCKGLRFPGLNVLSPVPFRTVQHCKGADSKTFTPLNSCISALRGKEKKMLPVNALSLLSIKLVWTSPSSRDKEWARSKMSFYQLQFWVQSITTLTMRPGSLSVQTSMPFQKNVLDWQLQWWHSPLTRNKTPRFN